MVEYKANKLHEWIEEEKDRADFALYGVVLAPTAPLVSSPGPVQILCGDEAQQHLGGLLQVFRWLT